jgi:hypothetical protein
MIALILALTHARHLNPAAAAFSLYGIGHYGHAAIGLMSLGG